MTLQLRPFMIGGNICRQFRGGLLRLEALYVVAATMACPAFIAR